MGKTEERIAEFIIDTQVAEIPEKSYAAAREAAFDCIGVTLAGVAQPHGQMIIQFAMCEGGHGDSTILGTSQRTSATAAALANGTLGHALDFDDMGGFGHPSVVLLPAALALGEQTGASGRDLLAAYIIGFEVGYHLSRGSRYHQGERGFHSTAVFGTMAATAASCRLLGLSKEQTVMALGIAGSTPSGVLQNFGTYTKPLHAGMASRNGVMAALLAKEGWMATESIIESKVGWAAAYIGQGNYDPAKMVDDLGSTWASQDTIVIKKYPCCGSNHSTLDSLLSLVREQNIALEDIEEVEVTGFPAISHVLLYPEPAYAFQGKFSVHYNVATALADGRIDMESFSEERLQRPEYREAVRKVEIKTMSDWDPEYRAAPVENPVAVRLKDGRVLMRSTNRHQMHGTPADPLTRAELVDKFTRNARLVLPDEAVDEAVSRWWRLDEVDDVREAVGVVSGEVLLGEKGQ